jgi:hypothetical protein
MEENGITGVSFTHPVYHRSGQPITSVFQMQVETVARPGLVTEDLVPEVCTLDLLPWMPGRRFPEDYPACGRIKYNYPRRDPIRFRRSIFDGMPDVIKSHEYLGSGGSAMRLILVSNRFYRVVKGAHLPGLRFTPVCLS